MAAPALTHLARRFVESLWPAGPSFEGEAWARSVLSEAELGLWQRMSAPDRRHAVKVARRVEAALGSAADEPVLAAALLHDVGKVVAGLGTFGRVLAAVADRFDRPALTPRVAAHLRYPEEGAVLLAEADSHPLVVAWAREHHWPAERWTVPSDLGAVLQSADE